MCTGFLCKMSSTLILTIPNWSLSNKPTGASRVSLDLLTKKSLMRPLITFHWCWMVEWMVLWAITKRLTPLTVTSATIRRTTNMKKDLTSKIYRKRGVEQKLMWGWFQVTLMRCLLFSSQPAEILVWKRTWIRSKIKFTIISKWWWAWWSTAKLSHL